jgi:hypothetical protein
MVRVAGLAAAGGAIPFLLYAAIRSPNGTGDERVTGALSSLGLVGGAWLGFYLTSDMDRGLDVPDGKPAADAPVALVGRSSDGAWGFSGVGLSPLSHTLAAGIQEPRGLTLSLVGATF